MNLPTFCSFFCPIRAVVEPNKGKLRDPAARIPFDAIVGRVIAPEGVAFREGRVAIFRMHTSQTLKCRTRDAPVRRLTFMIDWIIHMRPLVFGLMLSAAAAVTRNNWRAMTAPLRRRQAARH